MHGEVNARDEGSSNEGDDNGCGVIHPEKPPPVGLGRARTDQRACGGREGPDGSERALICPTVRERDEVGQDDLSQSEDDARADSCEVAVRLSQLLRPGTVRL